MYVEKGSKVNREHFKRNTKFGKLNLMVFGVITYKGVGQIEGVDVKLDGKKYKRLLEDAIYGSCDKYDLNPQKIVFVQDNEPCHKAKMVMEWFGYNRINVLDWPPQSPDMNIIENVWGVLNNKVLLRYGEIKSETDLWRVIQEEWYKIDLSYIQHLYRGYTSRLEELKRQDFDVTKY